MTISNDDEEMTDDYFGAWFSGFTDGEGCFRIDKHIRRDPRAGYQCSFSIHLRDDDKAILKKIQNRLGVGRITDCPASTRGNLNHRPATEFYVNKIADCVTMARLFDKYPLQAKKQRDFEVWRKAVFELRKPVDCRNADLLEYYFYKIKEVRQYEKQDELVKPVSKNVQLTIGF